MNYDEKPMEFWKAVLGEVELKLSPMVYKSLVSRTSIEVEGDGVLTILCEDDFVKNNVEKRYRSLIEEAANKLSGKNVTFKTSVRKNAVDSPQPRGTENSLGPLFVQQQDPTNIIADKQRRSNLSPKFTFENFLMGKNNNLAYAVATAVAQKPGELYNPVFIYSGVGLGKTHLIQAIGNEIVKNKPGTNVIYTTGETFANELIEAIKGGQSKGKYTTNDFRNKFRKADVFLIDDIQFVIGKDATQEEFFHTFNSLYIAQKQIVITSDRPPKDFNNIEERITSRFSSGIVADMQAPDMEMRSAILRTKRDRAGDDISNEIIDYIAETVNSNVRELEGAYIQVLSKAMTNGTNLTKEDVAKTLGQTMKEARNRSVGANDILKAVCTYYAVKVPDVKGKRRTRELVIPRQVAMFLMKEMTNAPLMAIGDFLGGRDHTTIIHGVRTIEGEIQKQGKIRQDVVNVKSALAE